MMQQNNSLAIIMANFDSRSITVHPLSTADASAIFLLKKAYQTLSICGHLPKSILHFFPQKTSGCKKVPTLRSDSFCDQQCLAKRQPFDQIWWCNQISACAIFFSLFFSRNSILSVECASLLWLSNVCFRLSSSVKKKIGTSLLCASLTFLFCSQHMLWCNKRVLQLFLLNSLSLNWIIKKIQLIFQRTPFVDILLNVDKLSDDKK